MLKIGSFNVHEWINGRNKYSYPEIADFINNAGLDIIGLQETSIKKLQGLSSYLLSWYCDPL